MNRIYNTGSVNNLTGTDRYSTGSNSKISSHNILNVVWLTRVWSIIVLNGLTSSGGCKFVRLHYGAKARSFWAWSLYKLRTRKITLILKRNILFAIVILVLLGILLAVVAIYDKPHRNIDGEKATYELTLDQFNAEFVENQNAAYQKYSEKVVQLTGVVSQINNNQSPINLLLSESNAIANCEMAELSPNNLQIQTGDQIVIKCLFIGYDDLLGELQLKKCDIINQ